MKPRCSFKALTPAHSQREREVDIDDDFGLPAGGCLLDAQGVIGDRLHFVLHLVARLNPWVRRGKWP